MLYLLKSKKTYRSCRLALAVAAEFFLFHLAFIQTIRAAELVGKSMKCQQKTIKQVPKDKSTTLLQNYMWREPHQKIDFINFTASPLLEHQFKQKFIDA